MTPIKTGINLARLRQDTLDAIARGKEMEAQKLVEDTVKEEKRHVVALTWAELVLIQIPACCKAAAAKGESKAFVIANTQTGERNKEGNPYSVNGIGRQWCGWNRSGEGLKYNYLCDLLSEIGLEVETEYEWDGDGTYSGISIYVSW